MEWGDRPEYFENLEIIRRQALRVGVPFWNVILATPHFSYRDPSPADMRWQAYTTLAYGGKGLAYFTYWIMVVNKDREHAAWTTVRLDLPGALVEEVGRSDGALRPLREIRASTRPKATPTGPSCASGWRPPTGG